MNQLTEELHHITCLPPTAPFIPTSLTLQVAAVRRSCSALRKTHIVSTLIYFTLSRAKRYSMLLLPQGFALTPPLQLFPKFQILPEQGKRHAVLIFENGLTTGVMRHSVHTLCEQVGFVVSIRLRKYCKSGKKTAGAYIALVPAVPMEWIYHWDHPVAKMLKLQEAWVPVQQPLDSWVCYR
jgi:hypothetical protein